MTRPLIGLPVSRIWRGHGTAIFLEVGALQTLTRTSKSGQTRTHERGEVTFMLEWSWRVESPRKIRFGSWSPKGQITQALPGLRGRSIVDVAVEGRLPELVVALSGSRWLHTFMTAAGEPVWAIRLQDESWLAVWRGAIIHQRRVSRQA